VPRIGENPYPDPSHAVPAQAAPRPPACKAEITIAPIDPALSVQATRIDASRIPGSGLVAGCHGGQLGPIVVGVGQL